MAKSKGVKGNTRALRHGGASSRKQLTYDDEFDGPAREIELRVQAEYEEQGALAMAERRAHRQATVEEIYFRQWIAALEQGDIKKATGYVKIFLWAGAKADRTYERVEAIKRETDNVLILDAMEEFGGD